MSDMLPFDVHGQGPPLLILHGLLGSRANWRSVARALSDGLRVITPDLRNHGDGPRLPGMDYRSQADDVLRLMDAEGLPRAALMGHSMGGKIAMLLALERPGRVARLCVVDIAPVAYRHDHGTVLEALQALDLDALASREQADDQLARWLDDPALRGFLLQGLRRDGAGWRWRVDLGAVARGLGQVRGFPAVEPGRVYEGPALFLRGERSPYVGPEEEAAIRERFPRAWIETLADAGHWPHVEARAAFLERVRDFFTQRG